MNFIRFGILSLVLSFALTAKCFAFPLNLIEKSTQIDGVVPKITSLVTPSSLNVDASSLIVTQNGLKLSENILLSLPIGISVCGFLSLVAYDHMLKKETGNGLSKQDMATSISLGAILISSIVFRIALETGAL